MIPDVILAEAISIEDAILPNGPRGVEREVLRRYLTIDDETMLLKLRLNCAPININECQGIFITIRIVLFDANRKVLTNFNRSKTCRSMQ